MNTEEIRNKTKEIINNLLEQNATEEDKGNLKSFQILHNAYLKQIDEGKTGIEWEKVESLPKEFSIDYNEVKQDYSKEEVQEILRKMCIVKINGGLGTSMGCTGPKSVIEVRNGMTFLDIIIKQLKALTKKYEIVVPLVLMNSFSTQKDTEEVIKKYSNDKDIKILTFLQHKFPRIEEETLIPVTRELQGRKEEWYPPGHGDFLQSFVDSEAFQELRKEGREYLFLSNVDNLGATPDIGMMKYFADKGMEYALELTPKTLNDIKGGTLIKYGNRLKMLEVAQVPAEHLGEFQDIKKFKVFNTNSILMKLESIEKVVKAEQLLNNMDIIVNRKKDGEKKVIQLEIAVGCAVSAFEKTGAFIVPRSRFLPVKACSDLFIIQSDLFGLTEEGYFVDKARKVSDIPPSIKLSSEFQYVSEYSRRMRSMPNIDEIESLEIQGNVEIGEGVVMKGKVVIRNNKEEVMIISNCVLDNQIIEN